MVNLKVFAARKLMAKYIKQLLDKVESTMQNIARVGNDIRRGVSLFLVFFLYNFYAL